MLTYSQSTGELRDQGVIVTVGYSGFETSRNNPADEELVMQGPIPKGRYQIRQPRKWNNGWIMRLFPRFQNTRTDAQRFYLKAGPISKGCINVPEAALLHIVELVRAQHNELEVTA